MTTTRDIVIYQGQAFALSLPYAGTAGRGQRMHIRSATNAATVIQILTHNGDANARVLFDGTDAIDVTIGASFSSLWLVGADRVEWVYDIEDYALADDDDVVITHRGKCIVYGNRTRESDVTPSEQMPSGDGRYVRFDTAQGLSAPQQIQARENIGVTLAGSGDVVGPASVTDDRIAAFDGTTGKLIKQGTVTATAVASHLGSTSNPHSVTAAQVGADPSGTAAGAVSAHEGGADPHPGYLQNLSAGTADTIVTASADGTLLSRAAYTIASLISHVVARAQHTGTQLASTISDFATAAVAAVTWSTLTGKPSTFDPSAHKASHATGGGDALTAADIGAATAAQGALADTALQSSAIGSTVQAYDADLTTWAGVTPGTGIATALAVNVGSAGAPVILGGALGTPSSGTLTNCTGLPPAGITQSGATSNQVLTWNGSAWAPAAPGGGLSEPLTTPRFGRQSSALTAASAGETKFQFRDIARAGLLACKTDISDELILFPPLTHPFLTGAWYGSGTGALPTKGCNSTVFGTLAASTVLNSINAANIVTAATAGQEAIWYSNQFIGRDGSSAGDGYLMWGLIGFPDASYGSGATGAVCRMGVYASGALSTSGARPGGRCAVLEYSTVQSDTNWQLIVHNGTNNDIVDTGLAFTAKNTYFYMIHSPRGGSSTYAHISDLTNGTSGSASSARNTGSTALGRLAGVLTRDTVARNVRFHSQFVLVGGQI